MTNKKKIIIKIAVGLLVALILCTVISQSIYTKLLPEVKVYVPTDGQLETNISTTGSVGRTNTTTVNAKGNWKIKEVQVSKGDEVVKGDTLFVIDRTEFEMKTKGLELDVMKLQHQLNPEPVAATQFKLEELQVQLDIAKHALSMHIRQSPDTNETEIKQLEHDVATLKSSLSALDGLDDGGRDLRLMIKDAKEELAKLIAESASESAISAKRAEIAGLEASLDQYYTVHEQERELARKIEIAEDKLAFFISNEIDIAALKREELEFAVLQIENQMEVQPRLNAQQKKELQKQIEIATLAIENHKKLYPQDGKMIASESGVIGKLNVEVGNSIIEGQEIAQIISQDSKSCVEWSLSLQEGDIFEVDSEVTIDATVMELVSYNDKEREVKKQSEQTAIITKKEFDTETNQLNFTAEFEQGVKLVENTSPKITLLQKSEHYPTIVPVSCLKQEDDVYFVEMIEKRQGLFSEESVIKQVKVEVVSKNNLYAAIESVEMIWDAKLVQYASKPITNGTVVSVVS